MGERLLSSRLRSPISHFLALYCTWGQITKPLSVFSFFFLFFFSLFSTCFPRSVFVCCSHTLFWPQKERKGSVSRAVAFLLQAAEREAEDIAGHMGPCVGALMTRGDTYPCCGALFWLQRRHTHAQMYSWSFADWKLKQKCILGANSIRYGDIL